MSNDMRGLGYSSEHVSLSWWAEMRTMHCRSRDARLPNTQGRSELWRRGERFQKLSVWSGANSKYSVGYNAIQLNGGGKDIFKVCLHNRGYWLHNKWTLKMCHLEVSSINHPALGHLSDPDGYTGGPVALPACLSQRLRWKCWSRWSVSKKIRFCMCNMLNMRWQCCLDL